jgi:hypothetical protein
MQPRKGQEKEGKMKETEESKIIETSQINGFN